MWKLQICTEANNSPAVCGTSSDVASSSPLAGTDWTFDKEMSEADDEERTTVPQGQRSPEREEHCAAVVEWLGLIHCTAGPKTVAQTQTDGMCDLHIDYTQLP